MDFRVHWLAFTIWRYSDYVEKLYEVWFEKILGPLEDTGHGGRGFRRLLKAPVGCNVYLDPVGDGGYAHIEITGEGCDGIMPSLLHEFVVTMQRFEIVKFSRLDLAWDGVEVQPNEVRLAVLEGSVRTYAKREKFTYYESPWEVAEDGREGTSTVNLGSMASERMLRVYDRRGPTRLEFQLRGKRADLVAWDLLTRDHGAWAVAATAHLRDYVDFEVEGMMLEWWKKFVVGVVRAGKTIKPKEENFLKLIGWLEVSVSASLSVAVDVMGQGWVDDLVETGRRRRTKKYEWLSTKII